MENIAKAIVVSDPSELTAGELTICALFYRLYGLRDPPPRVISYLKALEEGKPPKFSLTLKKPGPATSSPVERLVAKKNSLSTPGEGNQDAISALLEAMAELEISTGGVELAEGKHTLMKTLIDTATKAKRKSGPMNTMLSPTAPEPGCTGGNRSRCPPSLGGAGQILTHPSGNRGYGLDEIMDNMLRAFEDILGNREAHSHHFHATAQTMKKQLLRARGTVHNPSELDLQDQARAFINATKTYEGFFESDSVLGFWFNKLSSSIIEL